MKADHTLSRRRFLCAGAATGIGSAIALGFPDAAGGAAAVVQAVDVLLLDTIDDLPAGTPAGTLIVVKT